MTSDELTSLAQYYHYQTEVSMKDKNQEAAIEELEQAENQDKTCSDLDELGDLSQILEMARQLGIDTDGLETSGEKEKNCCCAHEGATSNRSIIWVLRGIKFELHRISTSLYSISKALTRNR